MQITQQILRRLKPEEKPYEIRDSKLKGFILRVQPSGSMSYICEYARGKRITIGKAQILTLTQARNRAKEIMGDYARGIDPKAETNKTRVETLGEFLEKKYEPWAIANQQKSSDMVARVRRCFKDLLSKKLIEINHWVIEKYRNRRFKNGISPATINRDIISLKSVMSRAAAWGVIDENPLKGFRLSRVDENKVIRYLTDDEREKLFKALDDREKRIKRGWESGNQWRQKRKYDQKTDIPADSYADHLKPMVIVSINTGLRKGELFSLTWSDVSFEKKLLTVTGNKAKSKQTRHVPLNSAALDALKRWHKYHSEQHYVFEGRNGAKMDNIRKSWQSVLEAAGIEAFTWHCLRHSFASKLVTAGVDLNTVRELMGHSDINMTLRYAHLALEHKASAVAKLV